MPRTRRYYGNREREERNHEIAELSAAPGTTLNKLAKQYGMTRERVRQILQREGVNIFDNRRDLVPKNALHRVAPLRFVADLVADGTIEAVASDGNACYFDKSTVAVVSSIWKRERPHCPCGVTVDYGTARCVKCCNSPEAAHERYLHRDTIKRIHSPLYQVIFEKLKRGRCNVPLEEFSERSGLTKIQAHYLLQRGLLSYDGEIVNERRRGLWSREEAIQIGAFQRELNGRA